MGCCASSACGGQVRLSGSPGGWDPVGFSRIWRGYATSLDDSEGFAMLIAGNRPSPFYHNTDRLLACGLDLEGAS